VTVKGEPTPTDRREFGAVLGDEVTTGANTTLDAGSSLEGGATTDPGTTVPSDIDAAKRE